MARPKPIHSCMRKCLIILICLAWTVSGAAANAADTLLHAQHDTGSGIEKVSPDSMILALHEAFYVHRDGHHHGNSDDGQTGEHGAGDHVSHCHGCAVTGATLSIEWNEQVKPAFLFASDAPLPDPVYLTDHIPD